MTRPGLVLGPCTRRWCRTSYELAFVNGVGRRMEEPGLGLIAGFAFSAPDEDLKLRTK